MRPREVVRLTPAAAEAAERGPDLFELYPPPFDLDSSMVFVAALAPAAPLRRSFPDVPFLTLLGRAVLVIWFSRVHDLRCRGDREGRSLEDETSDVPYDELNVVALLRRREVFVPGIYATSDLSLRLGRRYGMPKQPIRMNFDLRGDQLDAAAVRGQARSFVRGRLLGRGRWLAWLLSRWWPRWSWPVRFPSGSLVRGLVQATPEARPMLVRAGALALEEPWLAEPLSLLPLGLYAPHLRVRLPGPESNRTRA